MMSILIRTLQRTYLPIHDWAALQGALSTQDLEINFIVSKIVLHQEGGDTLAIEDSMAPLVQELCLHAAIRLLQGEDYRFENWNYAGTVTLQHEGGRIKVHGDYVAPAYFDKPGLLDALLEGTEQAMGLMQKLHAFDPTYHFSSHAYFEGRLAEARRLHEETYGRSAQ